MKIEGANLSGGVRFSHLTVKKEFKLHGLLSPLDSGNFRHMSCSVLRDDKQSWGIKNKLNGFVYGAFADVDEGEETSIDVNTRIEWLRKQMPSENPEFYRPQPWRHLQKTLKDMGHGEDARKIGIVLESERRKAGMIAAYCPWHQVHKNLLTFLRLGIRIIYGLMTGYGYSPLRLLPFFWYFGFLSEEFIALRPNMVTWDHRIHSFSRMKNIPRSDGVNNYASQISEII